MADALNKWWTLQRREVPEGSATAKAIDCSLNRWAALTRYVDDGGLPADNNWVENQIRPTAIESNNWLFAGQACPSQDGFTARSPRVLSCFRTSSRSSFLPCLSSRKSSGTRIQELGRAHR